MTRSPAAEQLRPDLIRPIEELIGRLRGGGYDGPADYLARAYDRRRGLVATAAGCSAYLFDILYGAPERWERIDHQHRKAVLDLAISLRRLQHILRTDDWRDEDSRADEVVVLWNGLGLAPDSAVAAREQRRYNAYAAAHPALTGGTHP